MKRVAWWSCVVFSGCWVVFSFCARCRYQAGNVDRGRCHAEHDSEEVRTERATGVNVGRRCECFEGRSSSLTKYVVTLLTVSSLPTYSGHGRECVCERW